MAALSRPFLRSSSHHRSAADESLVGNSATVKAAKRERYIPSVDHDVNPLKRRKPNAATFQSPNPIVQSFTGHRFPVGNGLVAHIDKIANPNHTQADANDSRNASARSQPSKKRHDHVVNGVGTTITVDKRSLRSHDGTAHLKSDLSLYFANYDELLSTEVKKSGRFFPLRLLLYLS